MDENHPLFDSYLKIRRARQLSEELRASKEAPPDGQPFQQKYHRDPKTDVVTVRLDTFPKWPPEQGVTAGEIAFHLRSALDYVVYQLCILGNGDPEREKTAFPLSQSPKEYTKIRGKRKISYRDESMPKVPEEWKAVIDGLQPFEGLRNIDAKHLWRLNSLTKRDKHRVRLKCHTWILTPLARVVFKRPETLELIARPGAAGTEIVCPDSPNANPKDLGVTFFPYDPDIEDCGCAVCFGPLNVSIDELSWMVDSVERVIGKFEPAFE